MRRAGRPADPVRQHRQHRRHPQDQSAAGAERQPLDAMLLLHVVSGA